MLPDRETLLHWDALVYLEMFVAGIAAGAYVTATILELVGRGRSPVARTAHLIAFPLMVLAAIFLTVDLARPDRFWHMLVASKIGAPLVKPWSMISLGTWLVTLFSLFAFVSFVDALVATRRLTIFGWRYDRTLHGTPLGLIWSMIGGLLGLGVGAYSGVLLSETNLPGWGDSPLIGALYVVTALVTGMAALLLIESIRGHTDREDVLGLLGAIPLLIIWQLVLLVVFLITVGQTGASVFLTGLSLLAIVGAVVLGGILPLVLRFFAGPGRLATAGLVALLVLVGGFLLRLGIIVGPQQHG